MNPGTPDIGELLDHTNPPEYILWNRQRIISCIDFLRKNIPLRGKRTLDLGHDIHVGSVLAHLGCDLCGNVAPDELKGHEKARGEAKFLAPDGSVSHWQLDEFNFEAAFPYADSSFELVTTMEVIEHVSTSPRAFLKEIKRVLKPDGYLFVATPNAASWAKLVRQLEHAPAYDSKPYSQDFGPRHVMCHVYEYTPWELKYLLESEGFEISALSTWDPYDSDPRGPRPRLLKLLFAFSLFCLGYVRQSALLYRNRGHQIGLIAKLKGK
jgi:SAM-dependent methyltransferase